MGCQTICDDSSKETFDSLNASFDNAVGFWVVGDRVGMFDAGDFAKLLDDKVIIFAAVVRVERIKVAICTHQMHKGDRHFESRAETGAI